MSRRDDPSHRRGRDRGRHRRDGRHPEDPPPAPPRPPEDALPPDPDDEWAVAEDGPTLRRASAPKAVGDVLGELIDRQGWAERIRAGDLERRWAEVVGEQLAGVSTPLRLAGSTLVVNVRDQVWATELEYFTTTIIEEANRLLGGQLVRDVRIRIGPVEPE